MALRDLAPWNQRPLSRSRNSQDALATLQDQVERTFNEMWNGFANPLAGGWMWGNGVAGRGLAGLAGLAATDISETDKDIEICVDLPGFQEKDIDVTLNNNALTIKAETATDREEDEKGYVYSERRRGSVHRSVALPEGTDIDNCEARFENGVLTVRLQKSERARNNTRRIPLSQGRKDQRTAAGDGNRAASGDNGSRALSETMPPPENQDRDEQSRARAH